MSGPAARPLRALIGVLAVYAGARVATATYDVLPHGGPGVGPNVGALLAEQAAGRPTATQVADAEAMPNAILPAARREPVGLAGPLTLSGATGVAVAAALPWRPRSASPDRIVRTMQDVPAARPFRQAAARPDAPFVQPATAAVAQGAAVDPRVPAPAVASPVIPTAGSSTRRGLSGSVWALAREGSGGRDLAGVGTLGGSQTGVRVNYDTGVHGLFATARASAALARRDREVAVGVGVRGRNVGLIVEQRFAIDGSGRNEAAALAYGGVSEVPLAAGLRLDAYAQAGVVGLSRRAAFVDGAARVERTLAEQGRWRLSAGAGTWGAAQPGAARLDVGPQLVARVPLGNINARIAAEYRIRVAGQARPTTGLTVTLGADF